MDLEHCIGSIIASYVAPTDHSELINEIETKTRAGSFVRMALQWHEPFMDTYKVIDIREDSVLLFKVLHHHEGGWHPCHRIVALDDWKTYFKFWIHKSHELWPKIVRHFDEVQENFEQESRPIDLDDMPEHFVTDHNTAHERID